MTEEERDAADPWLTLAEIADELRVNPATVRQWVTKGQLKASRAGVRKWIVRRSELERMLAATRRRGGCQRPRCRDGSTSDEDRGRSDPSAGDRRLQSAIALCQIATSRFADGVGRERVRAAELRAIVGPGAALR